MDLISIEHGRAIQLYVSEEIAPRAGLHLPEVVEFLARHYRFAKIPNPGAGLANGLKFEDGRLDGPDGAHIIELSVFNDGLIANCHDTMFASAVIDDVFKTLLDRFALRPPMTATPRSFDSAVIVKLAPEIEPAFSMLDELARTYSEALYKLSGEQVDVRLTRLAIGGEGNRPPKLLRTDFLIERRVGRAHADNWFYSSAPLPTGTHLELLSTFESAVERLTTAS